VVERALWLANLAPIGREAYGSGLSASGAPDNTPLPCPDPHRSAIRVSRMTAILIPQSAQPVDCCTTEPRQLSCFRLMIMIGADE
jgi:hypothetical protein